MPKGFKLASDPPASITSASPNSIVRAAVPMLWVDAAQAVVMVELGPLSPKLIAICPAAMLGMIIGASSGLFLPPL